VEQFRSQRLVAATAQIQRVLERVAVRAETLGDSPAAAEFQERLAVLNDRVAEVVDVADLRALVAEIRALVDALTEALRGGDGQ
jgi:hypothetical protein